MIYFRRFLFVGMLAVIVASVAVAQGNLNDPYEILNRYFEAVGGLDNLKTERTSYMEGELSVAGLQGTVKVWSQKPGRSRTEADLGIIKMIQGDNGEFKWMLDSNGKLQKMTNPDKATIQRKEIGILMDEYEYADPESEAFKASFEGIEDIGGKDCYVVRILNNINKDSYTGYYNTDTFLLEKSVAIKGEESNDTFYEDYRSIDGLKVAYKIRQISHMTGQEEVVTITEYVSNPDIDPSLFEPPKEGGKDYRFEQGDRAEDIPFKFEGNHLYIPVTINCKERYWILDTGAAMSVIGEDYAGELGLELQGDLKGMGAGGTVNIKLTTLPPFSLQGIQFDEQAAAVIDLKELNRMLAIECVGILGFDFLSRFVTKVDYADEMVSFYDPETFVYSGEGQEIDVHIKNSVFMVEASLDDDYTGTWLFDLGASSTSLNGVYALKNGFTERKGVVGLARGAANTFNTKRVKCTKIGFAGFTLDDPTISFSYGGTDTVSASDEIGILGNTLFRNFVVYCDYANERVILEKGNNFNTKFPEDHSGLQIIRGKVEGYEVLHVSEDTPADKAGFKAGDILKSINGVDLEYFKDLTAVRNIMKEDPGTKYTIIVSRDGEEKKMKLKLANLF
jgi:hypothetical protein